MVFKGIIIKSCIGLVCIATFSSCNKNSAKQELYGTWYYNDKNYITFYPNNIFVDTDHSNPLGGESKGYYKFKDENTLYMRYSESIQYDLDFYIKDSVLLFTDPGLLPDSTDKSNFYHRNPNIPMSERKSLFWSKN